MSTKADNSMLNHTARLLPLQEKADCSANSEGNIPDLCTKIGNAEFDGGAILTKIEGGDSNRTAKGKACCDD